MPSMAIELRTSRRPSPKPKFNQLRRVFAVSRRNAVWVTDITYIRTWQGWLYLAMIMDLFSRKIVVWATKPIINQLFLDAIMEVVRSRRFCMANHLEPSMSRRGK